MSNSKATVAEIAQAATNIRKSILKLAIDKNGCYLGQACSSAEILATLYLQVLNLGPSLGLKEAQPFPGVPSPNNMDYPKGALYHGTKDVDKDRFHVSPAHYASVVYCALVEAGRLSHQSIEKFNVDGWNLEMIGAEHSPGFENTGGSLGQTISIAAGTAHARKIKGEIGLVYVMLSDGEMQEGQVWEAYQAAAFYKLDNLVTYVDVNGNQVEGRTSDVMNIEPLAKRLKAFGAVAVEVNGHDINALIEAAKIEHKDKPLVILCKTSSYQGIPLLKKYDPLLHFVRPKADELEDFKRFYKKM